MFHNVRSVALSAVILITIVGCTDKKNDELPIRFHELENLIVYPSNTKPAFDIQLQKEQKFSSSDKAVIGRIGGIEVDDSGRVFIGDPEQYTVHVFKPNGSHMTTLGRKGHGPGEFVAPPGPIIVDNNLYLYDAMQLRVSIYSLDSLDLRSTKNLNPKGFSSIDELAGYTPAGIYVRSDNKYLAVFNQTIFRNPNHPKYNADNFYNQYYLMDGDGKIIPDKIFQQKAFEFLSATVQGEHQSMPYAFTGRSLIHVTHEGFIYSAWSDNFLIKVYNPDGKYERAFFHDYEKVKLTLKHAITNDRILKESSYNSELIKIRRQIIQNAELPKYWPVLNTMLVDDENQIWVSTIVENFDVYQWWVLDEQGKLLTRFTWPRDRQIEKVKDGNIYARENNEEAGLQEIVRYRIDMSENRLN